MTCPHCGAYSPKNTSICNRCKRKLPLLEAQKHTAAQQPDGAVQHKNGYVLPEHEGYGYGYRQPEPGKFGKFLEGLGSFLDEIVEDPVAQKGLLIIAAIVAVVVLVLNLCGACSCTACFRCSGCSDESQTPAVSFTDAVSGSDSGVTSFTDLSPTDAEGPGEGENQA